MSSEYPITIRCLFLSPGHNYFGRPKGQPGAHPTLDIARVAVCAGQGLVGDRFFGKGANFDGHVTFFAWEVYQLMMADLGLQIGSPAALRRNVIVEGANLKQLIGCEFAIDGVRFRGVKHCAPCRWMDDGVAPGALSFLHGRGGLRAQVLSDGYLQTGSALLTAAIPLDPTTITQPLPTPRLP